MSKPRTPSQRKAYRDHAQRLRKYVAQVQSVYDSLCQRAASIVEASGYDGEGEFSFGDYADIRQTVNDMTAQFVREMQSVVHSGTSEEWRQSNIIQDLLAKKVLKSYQAQVDGEKAKAYFQPNSDALKAFQERADHGMNLSDRIWNSVPSVRRELECTISTAVEKGFSAVTLSKRLSQYLSDFPSMQRDYTEKFGHAADCHDCEYNSIRLARTEINMSYRTAEQKRWQQFDFVTGYEIKLSGSHPRADICDDLQGKYPKDFVWTGWHPQCLCMALPVIMSEDDYWRMREGEPVKEQQITEVPDKVNEWVSDNADRIERAAERGTLPYWLRDNQSLLEGVTSMGVEPALRGIIVEENPAITAEVSLDEAKNRLDGYGFKTVEPVDASLQYMGKSAVPTQKELSKQTIEWGRQHVIGKKTYSNPAFGGREARFTKNSFTENLRYGELFDIKSEILTHLDDYLSPDLEFKFENPVHGTSRGFYKAQLPYKGTIEKFKGRTVELQFSIRPNDELYFYFIKII